MKALVFDSYGTPEKALHLRDIDSPVPKEKEVLVKVIATAVNDYDWSMVRGKPFLYRLMFGIVKPKSNIPGMEFAGIVESAGKNVTRFRQGDRVYGDISEYGFGSFAEYATVHEDALIRIPAKMPFEEAAALPHAFMLAAQALVDTAQITRGQNILINGAGGGVGTLGLQIAKTYQATVTGVDTGKKLEMMDKLGFDRVLDYKQNDFTRNKETYHIILDTKTNRPPKAYTRVLAPGGLYVTVGGDLTRLAQMAMTRWLGNKKFHVLALQPNKNVELMHHMYARGQIKPVLDGPYPLREAPALISYFGAGKHTGKVILRPFT